MKGSFWGKWKDVDETGIPPASEQQNPVTSSPESSSAWAWVSTRSSGSKEPYEQAARAARSKSQDARDVDVDSASSPTEHPLATGGLNHNNRHDTDPRNLRALHEAARTFGRRHARLQPFRDELLLLRDQANFEWEARQHNRRFVEDSQSELMDELARLNAELSDDPKFTKVRTLYRTVLADQQALKKRAERSTGVENGLSDLQYRVIKQEGGLVEAARRLLRLTAFAQPANSDGEWPSSVSSQYEVKGDESPERLFQQLPSPVITYFDKLGDVRVMRERVEQLVMDHDNDIELRAFQLEHDQPLESNDSDFQAEFERQYSLAEAELAEAGQIADSARRVCLNQDLDPDEYMIRPLEQETRVTGTPMQATTSLIPDSPSTIALGLPAVTPSALPLLALTGRNEVAATMPGPLHSSAFLQPDTRRADKRQIDAGIAEWLQDVDDIDHQPFSDPWEQIERGPWPRLLRSSSVKSDRLPVPSENLLTSSRSRTVLQDDLDGGEAGRVFFRDSRTSQSRRRSSESALSSMPSRHDSLQDIVKGLARLRT